MIKSGVSINEAGRIGYTPFDLSIYTRNIPLILLFIQRGAIINWGSVTNEHTDPDSYLFIHTAELNDVDVLGLLVSVGADINIKTSEGWSALHQACNFGCDKSIKFLIQKGADVTAVDGVFGNTPFATIHHLGLYFFQEADEIYHRELCVITMVR